MFCGAGGMSSGFKLAGFSVVGVDKSEHAKRTFELNDHGTFKLMDLGKDIFTGNFDLVAGGPPCKPWSAVNQQNRRSAHDDYGLVDSFFKHVIANDPDAFLLENVLPLKSDEIMEKWVESMTRRKFSVETLNVRYSDYGAATRRRRLLVFGTKMGEASEFVRLLKRRRRANSTVRRRIEYLKKAKRDVRDHEWPKLNTISSYGPMYRSGKYGWCILPWDDAAPSFGNVMKTYVLHPDSNNGGPRRVISVKEASLIMGFPRKFRFPQDIGMTPRYQMVADMVSPVFARAAARTIKSLLSNDTGKR